MRILLTDDWMERYKASAIPGAWYDHAERAWVLDDPTPRGAAAALKLFPGLGHDWPELRELRDSLAQDVRPVDYAREYGMPIDAPTVERQLALRYGDDATLYDFQKIDLGYLQAVLSAHGAAYLGWERGLGKTIGAAALIDAQDYRRTLVVCPNTAKLAVWKAELEQWLPGHAVLVLPNEKVKRERMLELIKQFESHPEPFVLIIHYEAINVIAKMRPARKDGWKPLGTWDLIVADEAHRIKNGAAQQARQLKRIKAHHKLALSGSIISNHAEELFSQLQWLFPDRYSSKWRDWNDRYLDYIDIPERGKVCLGVRVERIAELRDELGRFMVYRRKEDELDLPLRTEETRRVDLSPAQRKAYDALAQSCLARLDDGTTVKAADGLALLTRLRQVATGLDLVSGTLVDSSKQDLAVEIIKDNVDEAFVVFSWYKAAAYSLAKRLEEQEGIGTYVVTGDTKAADRAKYIEEFQAGQRRVFIGTISTLGESVTLHRASNAIFLDRSWNPGDNAQAADRIYRIGQQRPVTITNIVAADTVDETRVDPILADKEALRALILGGRSELQPH